MPRVPMQVDGVLVEKPDAARRDSLAQVFQLAGAVNVVKRISPIREKMMYLRAKRSARPRFHAPVGDPTGRQFRLARDRFVEHFSPQPVPAELLACLEELVPFICPPCSS